MNKLTTIITLITALFISSIITGCGEVNEVIVAADEMPELIPLTVGNSWTIQQIHSEPDTMLRTRISTSFVSGVAYLEGVAWYAVGDGYYGYLARNTGEGYVISFSNEPNEDNKLRYKYPAEVGDYWDDGFNKTHVVSVTETVKVKAGVFSDCILYRSTDIHPEDLFEIWIKPGVGYVKSISYRYGEVDQVYELMEYNLE